MKNRLLPLLLAALAAATGPAAADDAPVVISADDESLEWGPCPEFLPEGCAIAVLHGDPSQPNADVFFKVPGGAAIPWHGHTSAERMILVSGQMLVTYEGHEPAVVRPGDYAWGPPGLAHEAHCAEGDPCILFIAFEQPVDAYPLEKTEP